MTSKLDWTWLPHPAHFIGADECRFRMATEVGGYIVSTVGEYRSSLTQKVEEIGYRRKYETMVFKSKPSDSGCCPFEAIIEGGELDMSGYNEAADAYRGHIELCEKWSK